MGVSTKKIRFFYNGQRFSFKKRKQMKLQLENILKRERTAFGSINYVFCSDEELRKLNKVYLGHDYYTDILTFDLSTTNERFAEIFISVPRVKENARVYCSSFSNELRRVMIHGVLHLCGYKDGTPRETRAMRAAEQKYLAIF